MSKASWQKYVLNFYLKFENDLIFLISGEKEFQTVADVWRKALFDMLLDVYCWLRRIADDDLVLPIAGLMTMILWR